MTSLVRGGAYLSDGGRTGRVLLNNQPTDTSQHNRPAIDPDVSLLNLTDDTRIGLHKFWITASVAVVSALYTTQSDFGSSVFETPIVVYIFIMFMQNTEEFIGYLIGCVSAVLYLGSRLPQIMQNVYYTCK